MLITNKQQFVYKRILSYREVHNGSVIKGANMSDNELQNLLEARDWLKGQLDISAHFWLEHGLDHEHGGMYTCLDRTGALYSTDKSVWMQGRAAWTYSYLCHIYGVRPEWLNAAHSCIAFLEDHCINHQAGDRLFFTVTAEGKPLRQRRYNFSEGFYCIANAEYYGVTGIPVHLERARKAYKLIYEMNNGIMADPAGFSPKTIPGTRSTLSLADPMIFLNIISVMRRVDPAHTQEYDTHAKECVERIVSFHFQPELQCTLESVNSSGLPELTYTAGRVVNPGHDIECSWFLMDEALYQKDTTLFSDACKMLRFALEAGWDQEYDGILYFIDACGLPPEAYEHDMKLWWPHNEALIACSKAYEHTKDNYYLDWFYRVLNYCLVKFADPEYGEWYGYLRRDGNPTMPPTKGSTFKGPFHVPRSLCMTEQTLSRLIGNA